MNRFMEKLAVKNFKEGLEGTYIKSLYEVDEIKGKGQEVVGFSIIGEFVFKEASLFNLMESLDEVGLFKDKFLNFKFDDFIVQLFISKDRTIVFHATVDWPENLEMLDFFVLGVDLGTAISRARILLTKAVEKSIENLKVKLTQSPSL
ncbi:MAG: hypothetical protein VXY34_02680 [Bdellovibrionota bacterium]|nr:hypothetical protein [Bdellovibrionota bacterium]